MRLSGYIGILGIELGLKLIYNGVKKLSPNVVLYHSTDIENVKSIYENGLLGKHALDSNNLTNNVLIDVPKKDLEGLVYLTRSKSLAKNFKYVKWVRGISKSPHKILKIVIPYDDYKKLTIVDNPEVGSGEDLSDTYNRIKNRLKFKGKDFKSASIKEKILTYFYARTLGRKTTVVVKGDIDPKYIKGSKSYKSKLFDKEYLRNNKDKILKAAGSVALGSGLIGLGGIAIAKYLKK